MENQSGNNSLGGGLPALGQRRSYGGGYCRNGEIEIMVFGFILGRYGHRAMRALAHYNGRDNTSLFYRHAIQRSQ